MSARSFSSKRLTLLALLTAAALAIYLAEAAFPPPLPVPGVKLGLANVVTLIVLLCMRPRDAFTVLMLRIVLGSMLGGQMMSFAYSLSGGLLCFATMWALLRFLRGRYPVMISIFGALAHNAGQLLTAVWVSASGGLFAFAPALILSALLTGAFTGLCAQFASRFLRSFLKSSEKISDNI